MLYLWTHLKWKNKKSQERDRKWTTTTKIRDIKNNQIQILELKDIKTEIKISMDGFNKKMEGIEEKISEHEDKTI